MSHDSYYLKTFIIYGQVVTLKRRDRCRTGNSKTAKHKYSSRTKEADLLVVVILGWQLDLHTLRWTEGQLIHTGRGHPIDAVTRKHDPSSLLFLNPSQFSIAISTPPRLVKELQLKGVAVRQCR